MGPVPTDTEPRDRAGAHLADDAAFERACTEEWPRLVRFLRATAPAGLDIDDLAGRAIEIAWKRRADVQSAEELTPWLLGIAANLVRNAQRGSRRLDRLRRKLATSLTGASHPSAHAELLRHERGPATRALATLSAADREILVLHAWEELSNEEIAAALAISPAAAGQRLHRARKRLALALASLRTAEEHPS